MKNLHATRSGPGRRPQNISMARTNLAKHNASARHYNSQLPHQPHLHVPIHSLKSLPADFSGAKLFRAAADGTIGHRN